LDFLTTLNWIFFGNLKLDFLQALIGFFENLKLDLFGNLKLDALHEWVNLTRARILQQF